MRFLLHTYGIIINLSVSTLAVTDSPRDFVCDGKYIQSESVSRSLKIACDALTQRSSRHIFSAAFDGSVLFGIRDATLFVTPTNVCRNRKYGKKPPQESSSPESNPCRGSLSDSATVAHMTSRVVIDSMCNLVGLVYIFNQSYYRCTQVIDSPHNPTKNSETSLNISPKNYGYRCRSKIFLYNDVVRSFEYLKDRYLRLKGKKTLMSPKRTLTNDFTDRVLYLWTLYADRETKELFYSGNYPHVMAVNKDSNLVGMMSRDKKKWCRCVEMQFVEPEPPRLQDSGKNSIGETIFDNINSYICGRVEIWSTMLNSHMQAACRVIKEDSKKAAAAQTIYPMLRLDGTDIESDARFWLLRPPENIGNQDDQIPQDSILEGTHRFGKYATKSKYFIKLNLSCRFLGVYEYLNREFHECQKIQPSLPPVRKDPKLPDLNL